MHLSYTKMCWIVVISNLYIFYISYRYIYISYIIYSQVKNVVLSNNAENMNSTYANSKKTLRCAIIRNAYSRYNFSLCLGGGHQASKTSAPLFYFLRSFQSMILQFLLHPLSYFISLNHTHPFCHFFLI